MNDITPFSFESKAIRTTTDEHGDPWFVLRDLLEAMESKTSSTNALESIKQGLGEGFSKGIPLETKGGTQEITVIAEGAATYLVSRSNTEMGRRLNRFLHTKVLPTLRKTGRYAVPTEATLSPAQQRQLQNAIAAHFPDGKQRPYAWSRFNNHFALGSYKQLPSARLDEALAYVAQMPGAVDDSDRERQARDALHFARFLLVFDHKGQMQLREVPDDAFVFNAEELPRLVGDPDYPRTMLPHLIKAAAERLAA